MPTSPNHEDPDTIGAGQPISVSNVARAGDQADQYPGPALPLVNKVVLVMDLVESVRLTADDEAGVVALWHSFTQRAGALIAQHGGRVVKSLGDGLLAQFESARDTVQVALASHQLIRSANLGRSPDQHLYLRIGLNAAPVYVDRADIYGNGVNLAARLATLAGPGETIASSSLRDQITDGIDAEVQDMGECFLKHLTEPVRAYRIGPPGPRPVLLSRREYDISLQPTIAVIPFAALSADNDRAMTLGDAIADDVIAGLSQSASLRVISRLSTAPFRAGNTNFHAVGVLLGAAYIVSGSYHLHSGRVTVRAELCAAHDGQIVWADRMTVDLADIFHGQDKMVPAVVANVGRAILQRELERARSLPIPSLEAYTLYVGSIFLLHRLSRAEFMRSRDLLEHLSQLYPRSATPHAMLAKWHLMYVLQGWANDPGNTRANAKTSAQRALELEPANALALAMEGIVLANFSQDLQAARDRCLAATQANPQEPYGWLHLGAVNSYIGDTQWVEEQILRAIALSPLDPARFGFESFLCYGKLASGKFAEAAQVARSSIRLNACHAPAHRHLSIALAMDGKLTEAREAAKGLMRVDPSFRIGSYAQRYPGRGSPQALQYLDALRFAGLPA